MDTFTPPKKIPNASLQIPLAVVLLAFLFGLLGFANYQFARNNPGGTDFLYRWMPTRLYLFEGYQNPYSPEVEYQVELAHHGHPHQGSETPGIFAYPFYIIPFYIPFAAIQNYLLARTLWMTLLEIIHVLTVIITLRLFKIQLRTSTLIFIILFSLFFSFFSQPIIDGNPSPIAALFVILSLWAISKQKDLMAGILLAFSTIKPQMVLLFFILVWIWAYSHKRWKIINGSLISLIAFFGLSFIFLPVWFSEFLKDVILYPLIASPHSPITILDQLLPGLLKWISLIFSGFVIIILGWAWIKVLKKNFNVLFWTSCLTFMLSPISGISSAHSNFIATIPGFVLLVAYMDKKKIFKSYWVNFLIILFIGSSWFFKIIGQNSVLFGNSTQYFDILILPIIMTPALLWLRYRDDLFLAGDMVLLADPAEESPGIV